MSKRLLLLLAFCFQLFICTVYAQEDGILPGETYTQPKERSAQVTASVKDNEAPSTPILISPENNSIISTNKPPFVWKESTDTFGVKSYTLSLDGSDLFTNIPTTDTETDEYILTYNADTTYFSLTPKNALADGQHTWKITAHDFYTNTTSSVTWTFTIDTQSPVFVITQVDEEETSISAQDVSTVPTTPIILINNEPVLTGTGEADSDVVLTVRLPDGTTLVYEFTISEDGTWEVQLGLLPRDVIIYLDFLITDQVGHISVLNDVPIILPTPKIIIDIPLVPPEVIPPIEVPITPIIEIIPPIIEVIVEPLPESVQQLIAAFPFYYPTPQQPGYNYFTNFLVLLVISFLPVLKTILLAKDFGSSFSPTLLHEIWQAIGFIPTTTPQGIVVDSKTQQAVPYAKVIFFGKIDEYKVKEVVKLTNARGVYTHSHLTHGKYRLIVQHPQFLFPSQGQPTPHLNWQTYYQGQEITIPQDSFEPALIVPVEKNERLVTPPLQLLKYWILNRTMATFKLSTLCILITVLFPTIFNIFGTLLFWSILSYVRLKRKKLLVHGTVLSDEKVPVYNSILFLMRPDTPQVQDITQTKRTGEFLLTGSKDSAKVRVTDFSYSLNETTEEPGTIVITNKARDNRLYLPIILTPSYPHCNLPQTTNP